MSPVAIVIILLFVAVVLFATERIPIDIVTILLVIALIGLPLQSQGVQGQGFQLQEATIASIHQAIRRTSIDFAQHDFTLDDFIARGESHGFGWWLSGSDMSGGFCKSARILDAHGGAL